MKDKKITFMAYTDAASYNNGKRAYPNKPENTCSAGVVTLGDNIIYSFHNYNPNTTISYGELYAIRTLLVEFVPLMKGTKCKLILHTDSEYCFKSINIWYKNWINKARNGIWYSSTGPVPYQRMFEEILSLMRNNNIEIKHVSGGHFNVLDPKSIYRTDKYGNIIETMYGKFPKAEYQKAIKTCQERFLRNNKEKITKTQAEDHMFFNNICDQIAKKGLEYGMDGSDCRERKRKSFEKFIT